jgi:hypothetical protein
MQKVCNIDGIKKLSSYNICGIYFLMKDEYPIYIGQSVDIPSRVRTHALEGKKIFDSVFYIECEESKLTDMESYYIVKYSPIHNRTHRAFMRSMKSFAGSNSEDVQLKYLIQKRSVKSEVKKWRKEIGIA